MLQAAIHQKALCGQRRRWSKLGGGEKRHEVAIFQRTAANSDRKNVGAQKFKMLILSPQFSQSKRLPACILYY